MEKKDDRIDVYISKAEAFARPILRHVRKLVHTACPEVVEVIKWGFPHFEYKGLLCSMAAFKEHCSFGFWKASLMTDTEKALSRMGKTAMGNFGRLRSMTDLPSDKILVKYIKEAVRLNEDGAKTSVKRIPTQRKPLTIPNYLTKALSKNAKASAAFSGFNYSNRKEYVEWLTEAKTEETREKRLSTAIDWMSKGRIRNWKYARTK